ncbi:unnamed protein product [Amoebophrya sp. A25]|nr:unnamed protein product [Amoebophrya sp. A25]|eukprot:GSA25T00018087001.1
MPDPFLCSDILAATFVFSFLSVKECCNKHPNARSSRLLSLGLVLNTCYTAVAFILSFFSTSSRLLIYIMNCAEFDAADERVFSWYDASSDSAIASFRRDRLQLLKNLKAQCVRKNKEFWASAAHHVRAISGHIDTALIDELTKRLGLSDIHLGRDIREGFPIRGPLPRTGNWPAIVPGPQNDPPEEGDTPCAFRRTRPSWMGNKLIHATKENIEKELEKKWLHRLHRDEVRRIVNDEGGAVAYCHSIEQGEKIRTVMHFRDVNDATTMTEKLSLPSPLTFVRALGRLSAGSHLFIPAFGRMEAEQALRDCSADEEAAPPATKAFKGVTQSTDEGRLSAQVSRIAGAPGTPISAGPDEHRPHVHCGIIGVDAESAYKQTAIKSEHLKFNIIGSWDEAEGDWVYHRCYYSAFGAVASVFNWCRVSFFIMEVFRKFFFLFCRVYIDDFSLVERLSLIHASQSLVEEVCKLIGIRIASHKTLAGSCLRILGVEFSTTVDCVSLDIRLAKRQRLADLISDFIASIKAGAAITVKDFQKMLGLYNFLVVALRLGAVRGLLSPCYAALGKALGEPGRPLGGSLTVSASRQLIPTLLTLRDIVLTQAPTVFSFRSLSIHYLFCDASLSLLGFAALVRKQLFWARFESSPLLDNFFESYRSQVIHMREMVAVYYALLSLSPIIRGSTVVLFLDSQVALFSLLKGTSKDIVLRILAQQIHLFCARLDIRLVLRYIRSAENPADAPTRFPHGDCVRAFGADATEVRVASSSVDIQSLHALLNFSVRGPRSSGS